MFDRVKQMLRGSWVGMHEAQKSGDWSAPHSISSKGFTLLELLVVMVILGLLASFVAPRYFKQVGKAETKTARAQLLALEQALAAYRLDAGQWPSTEQGLQALVTRPAEAPRWAGPYLNKGLPPDPWGRAYVYRVPGDAPDQDYQLKSLGKDGRPGGQGEDADLSVWEIGR
jgi:general secretion pathway protein G